VHGVPSEVVAPDRTAEASVRVFLIFEGIVHDPMIGRSVREMRRNGERAIRKVRSSRISQIPLVDVHER